MRTWIAAVAATFSVLSLSACGSDDGDDVASDPTPSPATSSTSETPAPTPSDTEPPVDPPTKEPSEEPVLGIPVTIEGDTITPSGERIEVGHGETLFLEITSDRAGELHVHSKPEQFVEFEAGTSTHELVIKAPGVVDVEEHESGQVIVQLEVG